MGDIISLSNYQSFGSPENGGGIATSGELDELRKALAVGQLRGSDSNNVSGGVLKVESLERTLKDIQFKESDIALWQLIKKLPAYSTVEEYNRLLDYGAEDGGFIGEGDLPEETDNTYERVAELVKYIGTTRSTTLQAQLVSTNVGDMKLHQVKTGTKWTLRKADRALFLGNANVIPHEWNGFLRLHQSAYSTLNLWQDSTEVIDLRGAHLSEDKLESASQNIIENHGDADLLIAPTDILSNFAKQFHGSKWFPVNTDAISNGEVGQRVKKFHSAFGTMDLKYDKFMNDQIARYTTDNATHEKAPAAPVVGVAPIAAVTDTDNRFGSTYAGDYFVGVAAVNRFGRSAITIMSTSLTSVASTESLDIQFTAGSGSYAATGYVVYMSVKDPSTAYNATKLWPVFSLSLAELAAGFDGAAATKVRIKNRFIPNTRKAILIENDPDIWAFKQLAPIMKMDLARVSTADRFMILLFGTPQLYMPKKMVIIINAGQYVAS